MAGLPRKAFAILVLLAVLPKPFASAQFTYVGSDFGYSNIVLKGHGHNYISTLPLRLSVTHRPLRHVGFGVTYAIPLSQRFAYSPVGAPSIYEGGWQSGYSPTIINHLTAKDELSGFLRIYVETNYNFFVDFRIRSYLIEQYFSLHRAYTPPEYDWNGSIARMQIPLRSAEFSSRKRSVSPGLSVGMSPHIGKHGFLSVQFEIDFVELKSLPFSMTIESGSNYREAWYQYKTIRSDLHGPTIAWMIVAGGGVFF